MFKRILLEIITFLLVLLFTYASFSKLLDFHTFRSQLNQSPYLAHYAGIIVWLVPLSELLICVLLMLNKTRLAGLYLSFAMMLAFTFYIYAILHFSAFIPCSCGGILSQMSWKQHLVFNIIFTILALAGVLIYPKRGMSYEN
jgi:uncharacterized membrane protein YphA (DoxX/SURF4 family)